MKKKSKELLILSNTETMKFLVIQAKPTLALLLLMKSIEFWHYNSLAKTKMF